MRKFVAGLLVFIAFAVLTFTLVLRNQKSEVASERGPSSYNSIVDTIRQIERDIEDPRIFNPQTAVNYLNGLAERAYLLKGSDFAPNGEQEERKFVAEADAITKDLFALRVRLPQKLGEFESLQQMTPEQRLEVANSIRRAQLYLSYATDYVAQILDKLSPLESRDTLFKSDGPLALVNPKFRERDGGFKFKAGDIILVRGNSFFSATIARISDTPTNLSHSATVVETETGELRVVEALLEKNMTSYTLDEYLNLERLPRAAVYRFHDPAEARKAGQELWLFYKNQLKNPLLFDILMDANDHSKVYCFEGSRIGYELASNGKTIIPRYESSMKKVAQTDFAKQVGLTVEKLSAPADLDIDSRFELVAEHRDTFLLNESRRFDVVVSKIFELFGKGFTYQPDPGARAQAIMGVAMRSFGLMKSKVPAEITVGQFAALIRHKNLVTALMDKMGVAEKAAMRKNGGMPLAYRESEVLFDQACGTTCVKQKAAELSARPIEEEVRRVDAFPAAGGGKCELLFRPAF